MMKQARFSSGWGIYSPLMMSNLDLGSVNLRAIYYIAYPLRLGPWYALTEFGIKLRPSSYIPSKLFQSAQEHGGFLSKTLGFLYFCLIQNKIPLILTLYRVEAAWEEYDWNKVMCLILIIVMGWKAIDDTWYPMFCMCKFRPAVGVFLIVWWISARPNICYPLLIMTMSSWSIVFFTYNN